MSLVYDYETEHRALPLTGHRVFQDQAETEHYVWELVDRYQIPLTSVVWTHGNRRWACATGTRVELPNNEFGRSIITVLHELAHVLAPPLAGHGPQWLYWFTYLLRHEVGIMASSALLYELS